MGFDQSRPPKPKFSVSDIPDMTGKVVIVTGGNTGIGRETVRALLKKNAKVYVAARSREKAEKAIKEELEVMEKEGGKGEAVFLELDLAELKKVKKAAEEFARCVFVYFFPS